MNTNTKALSESIRKAGVPEAFFRDLSLSGYKNQPSENYVHFVVLQELLDYTLFTQDGSTILLRIPWTFPAVLRR